MHTSKGTELPLIKLKGKDYLEVKYRIVWFREEHPDWGIETEMIHSDERAALAKATLRGPDGRIMATSHKYEDKVGFADYREKAETGAIGRALALCGYGTQFAPELDEGERVVDSPGGKVVSNNRAPLSYNAPPSSGSKPSPQGKPIGFGKFKGQTFNQIPLPELENYAAYLMGLPEKKQFMMDFLEEVQKFIATQGKPAGTPPRDDGDPGPAFVPGDDVPF